MNKVLNPNNKVGDFPDTDYAKTVCKIGQGAECCRYITMAPTGWSCEKHGSLKAYIDFRVLRDAMVSKGDNCEGKDSRKSDSPKEK